MNVSSHIMAAPVLDLLIKWTVLLALGWVAHWIIRKGDAQWRLILWRGLLCCGLALPLVQLAPLPAFEIHVNKLIPRAPQQAVVAGKPDFAASRPMALESESQVAQVSTAAPASSFPALPVHHQTFVSSRPVPWRIVLLALWAAGGFWGAFRLVRFMRELSELARNSTAPDVAIDDLVRLLQGQLGVTRHVRVLVSEAVTSPFVFGVFSPTIMLPGNMARNLLPSEMAALLSHELAHLRGNDLFWCVSWRWMNSLFWFHPLAWKIPAAHNLACDEEADRVASSKVSDRASYSQLLAKLALRALNVPIVETQLTTNGTAQITLRLLRLKMEFGSWNRKHSFTAYGIVLALLAIAVGCKVLPGKDFVNQTAKPKAQLEALESGAPYSHTQPPGPVTANSATLHGMVAPNGQPALAWFQWGTSTNYEYSTPVQSVGDGNGVIRLSVPVKGLVPGGVYHYRVMACTVGGGVTRGTDFRFTTGMSVVSWGGPATGNGEIPNGLTNVVAIACGHGHSLALKCDGTVAAWGGKGGSGLDPYSGYTQTTVPPGLRNVIAIAGGFSQSLAVTADGKVVAWGEFMDHTPVFVPDGLKDVIAVAAGDNHAMALKSDGTVAVWGDNRDYGTKRIPRGLSNVVAITSGSGHCVALKADGGIVEWGNNFDAAAPKTLSDVVAISGDAFTCLALQSDHTVTAWGSSGWQDTAVPSGLGDVVAIAAGWKHSMALRADGSIAVWGDDSQFQTMVPSTLLGAVAIASGDLHCLALGRVYNYWAPNTGSARLRGTVRYPDGKAAAGVQVLFYPGQFPGAAKFAELTTDSGGRYEVTTKSGGFEGLWVGPICATNSVMAIDQQKNLAAFGECHWSVTNLDLTLAPGITLSGSVEDSNGAKISDAKVKLEFVSGEEGPVRNLTPTSVIVDKQGDFFIRALPKGLRWIVNVSASGYGSGFFSLHPDQIHGDSFKFPSFALKRANRRVAGRVLAPQGKPLPGANVSLSGQGQPQNLTTLTDTQGSFFFDQVCEGALKVFASCSNYLSFNGGNGMEANSGHTNLVIVLEEIRH